MSTLQVKLDPRFVSGDTPPLSCRAFLLRLLNNLKQVYITLNMAEEALAIVRYAADVQCSRLHSILLLWLSQQFQQTYKGQHVA